MSKQRTNNNKRPANSRPASSKGRSNSAEGGRGPKKSSNTRSTSSRSEEGRSSRSGFDKKTSSKRPSSSSRGGSERGPKEEKDLYGSKRTTQSRAKKFETSKRAVGRGPSGRKPAKKSYTDKDESFIPYDKRSEDTKSPYIKRGIAQSGEDRRPQPDRGVERRPAKRSDSRGGDDRSPAKRSYTKRGEGSAEYKSRAGEGRSSAPKKTFGPKREDDSRSGRGPAAKFPNKRTSGSREESGDFKRKPTTRRSFDADEKESKPRGRKELSNDDFDADFDADFSDEDRNKKDKPKFDKDQVKKGRKAYENKLDKLSKPKPNAVKVSAPDSFEIRLNKYISNSGICSRREADQLIIEGTVKVNGIVVTELGYKVKPGDSVKYNNKVLNPEKSVYVLLNKPKDFITTMEDENDRKTVMQLVANATKERIYPVGRLDRNTTGLLLFTNDGELAQKLTHPSNKVKKIYEVELDKPITAEDFDKIVDGKIHLFDGPVKVDEAAIISPSKKIIGIEIHEGRNRIVRRIFESLGYDVLKLDRVMYAGLTKKNIPRGSWRYLTATEVNKIKYLD
ncbi:pseudouridine synthase [Cytophaga hutchinsonii]|uniref:Pseudouridine synthase n=1 Tax=Cytophaga hutchinsonii (strain ATCC 33406 / DSM 1761 / CIP 103989 / NBRC 15051 / NCIMB 9469 / D465) TaxID=269798 RepID=A0A6N4SME7_CYTH3|nr:pseudouridine synthase [Cytophaga hutchinsonii]ABG57436.1 pseudouridylate synthase (ribosomal large subunit pseudouridine synthase B) [Cytophaga hutchinsonii ATCC 33406]SFX98138.1 23S rRNA pseudouridine2605 synthase [Cytophaga hutchinsonii ATCC 33406]